MQPTSRMLTMAAAADRQPSHEINAANGTPEPRIHPYAKIGAPFDAARSTARECPDSCVAQKSNAIGIGE
jgi:hypothetical protein